MAEIQRARCILLVEDNADEAALTVGALRDNRIANEIVLARDGAEARDFLFGVGGYAGRDACEVPDLVLLDLRLPKIDGIDVLRRIRADDRTKRIPVVVLTSSAHEDDVVQAYEGGANSYIRKPVDFESFVTAIERISAYWLVVNEPPARVDASLARNRLPRS